MTAPEPPQIVIDPSPTPPRRREFSVTPPRFSITHGYLWVTFASIFLAMVQAQPHPVPGLVGIAIASALSMLIGAAWSLAAILIYRWWQTAPWLCEPGHWLGAAIGFRYAVLMILSTYFRKFISSEQPICEVVTSGILLLPLFGRRQPSGWKVVFGVLLLVCLMPNLMPFFRLAIPPWKEFIPHAYFVRKVFVPLTAIGLVAVYAIGERTRGTRRNWLHVVGVTVWSLYWIADWGLRRNG